MFGKKYKTPKLNTIIGEGTNIHGDLHFAGGLHVQGNIKGNVSADADTPSALTVDEQGNIEGDVRVPNILINGTINGDVYATQRVELASKARITGNVYYTLLEMAMGSEVNGQLLHTTADSPRMTGFRRDAREDIEEV